MNIKLCGLGFLVLGMLQWSVTLAQNSKKWALLPGNRIEWKVKNGEKHADHIEMAGLQTAAIIDYGVRDGRLILDKKLIFPMLRTIPNNTHGSLTASFQNNNSLQIKVNGQVAEEYPLSFTLDGKLAVYSKTNSSLNIQRTLFPSVDKPILVEQIKLVNTGNKPLKIDIKNNYVDLFSDPAKSVYGQYHVRTLI